MALPIIAALALGAAVVHEVKKSHYRELESERKGGGVDRDNAIKKSPSDSYASNTYVKPVTGSIVCCEVYGVLDHTGIWIDENTIVELGNNGLVKAVSANRFLDERSGENIFIACDHLHHPIVIEGAAERAINSIFTYRGYDVIENNCHRFVSYCLSGNDTELTRFSSLNDRIFQLSHRNIYWDKVRVI